MLAKLWSFFIGEVCDRLLTARDLLAKRAAEAAELHQRFRLPAAAHHAAEAKSLGQPRGLGRSPRWGGDGRKRIKTANPQGSHDLLGSGQGIEPLGKGLCLGQGGSRRLATVSGWGQFS